MRRIGTLKIALWRPLQQVQRGAASSHAAARELAGHHPVSFRIQEQVAISSNDVGLAGEQIAECGLAEIAMNAGREESKTTAVFLSLNARDKVIGEWLDFLA